MFCDGNGYINNYFGFESQVEIITRICLQAASSSREDIQVMTRVSILKHIQVPNKEGLGLKQKEENRDLLHFNML